MKAKEIKINNDEIKKIIKKWKMYGLIIDGRKIPLCPELVYRVKGTWKGWGDIFPHDDPEKCRIQDAHEDIPISSI